MSIAGGRRHALAAAGLLGALAVLAGAFGAHGLEARLAPRMLDVWDTAARYHLLHAVALLALAAAGPLWAQRSAAVAAACWGTGMLLFSGSLYLLAVTGIGVLGAITPLGGVALVAGWCAVAVAALRAR